MNYLFFKNNRLHVHVDVDDWSHVQFDVANYFATKGLAADKLVGVIERINHMKELGGTHRATGNYDDAMSLYISYMDADYILASIEEVNDYNPRLDGNIVMTVCVCTDYNSKIDLCYCNTPYDMRKDAEDIYNKKVAENIRENMLYLIKQRMV